METMLEKEIHECCRPFVIGSVAIMERAAKILGKELRYNRIRIRKRQNLNMVRLISLRRVNMIQILLNGEKYRRLQVRWQLTGL